MTTERANIEAFIQRETRVHKSTREQIINALGEVFGMGIVEAEHIVNQHGI